MQRYAEMGKSFNDIYDLLAIRVQVENLADCYHALGIVHGLWRPLPGLFERYAASPQRKLVFCQNPFYAWQGLAGRPSYSAFGVSAVMCPSLSTVQYFRRRFPDLPAGRFRHADHRFEWTRAEFRAWAEAVAARHGYRAEFAGVGEADPQLGPPCQMAAFTR